MRCFLSAVSLAAFLLASQSQAQNISFLTRHDIPTSELESLTVGDFNSDGIPDLAALNQAGEAVQILFGAGDGTFRPGPSFRLSAQGITLAAGDFNNDGNLDVIVLGGLSATVLLGQGNGAFLLAGSQSLPSTPASGNLVVADFNLDGKLDFAASNSQSVSISLGNGDGTFQPPSFLPIQFLSGISTADLNSDGKPDLVAIGGPGLYILLGNGNGTFTPRQAITMPVISQLVAIGDLNGDGKLDLAALATNSNGATYTPTPISTLLGNGDGTFQPPVNYNCPYYLRPLFSLALADMNGDGFPDLIVGSGQGEIADYLNSGDAEFQFTSVFPISLIYSIDRMVVADFTGNGHTDVAISNSGGGDFFSVLLHAGADRFLDLVTESIPGYGAYGPAAAGDFNGDGKLDLVLAITDTSSQPQLQVLLGTQQTSRPFDIGATQLAGQSPYALTVGDFNADGALDAALSGPSGIIAFAGNGQGAFAEGVLTQGSPALALATGDVNADGKLDIVSSSGQLYLGKGDGTFQTSQIFSTPIEWPLGGSVTIADFNGDGFPDVIFSPAGPTYNQYGFGIILGRGDGTFQPAVYYSAGGSPQWSVVADFNGDGILDVAVLNNSSGGIQPQNTIAILLGNGDGSFQAPQYTNGKLWDIVDRLISTDLNGDGKVDLAILDPKNNEVFTFVGNGDGTFQPDEQWFGVGPGPESFLYGDFHGQTSRGIPDIVSFATLGILPAESITYISVLWNESK
jgi:hypothetical protein